MHTLATSYGVLSLCARVMCFSGTADGVTDLRVDSGSITGIVRRCLYAGVNATSAASTAAAAQCSSS